MAKISDTGSYPQATVTGDDYLIGTDSADSNKTKTFTVDSLSTYILGGSGAAYVVPVYVSGTQFGNSIISQDAAVGTAITIAGALTVNLTLTALGNTSLGTLFSTNESTQTIETLTATGIQTLIAGTQGGDDVVQMEANLYMQGRIQDAGGDFGTAGQTLVSNASGLAFWT
tara:strand:+ start:21 stop:533 length:513 start_codon:yes stop_codon:yes gene_type:complete